MAAEDQRELRRRQSAGEVEVTSKRPRPGAMKETRVGEGPHGDGAQAAEVTVRPAEPGERMEAWDPNSFEFGQAAGLDAASRDEEPASRPHRGAARMPAWAGGASAPGVQRKASGSGGASSSSPSQRRKLEFYLLGNQQHVWRAIGEHARSVEFPSPEARLSWMHQAAFVRTLLMQLESHVSDFQPLAKLDEVLYPSTAERTLGELLPSTDAWFPPLGLAIAQALQLAIVASLRRLGPRYVAVADAAGVVGDNTVDASQIVATMPIDRYVAAAMATPRSLSIEPPAAGTKAKSVALRPVALEWEGARDPQLWNWVRARHPADATAEEVAAALQREAAVPASFGAYLLAAAAPLFGLPRSIALQCAHSQRYAPAHALGGDDRPEAQLVALAKTSVVDEVALHQSPPGAHPAASSGERTSRTSAQVEILTALHDCSLQLTFAQGEAQPWGLAGLVAPALTFVHRKQLELLAVDAKLAEWMRVIAGQRDRLARITGAFHRLASATQKLGVRDRRSPEAAPVREILEQLAIAAGTSHLAQPSEAALTQAMSLQAGLSAKAVQATERELQAANLEVHDSLGSTRGSAQISHDAAGLQDRSRRLQTQLINGSEVDAAELDEVTLASEELALRSRLLGTLHSVSELQLSAIDASDGLSAHVAQLFSGKFRNLASVCAHLTGAIAPIQATWMETTRQLGQAAQRQVSTPEQSEAQKQKSRAARRAALARAQTAFRKLAQDEDLQHFFRDGAKLIQNQQFRTACVQVAALIGIGLLAAATGGAAAELAGGLLMGGEGAVTVVELSAMARLAGTAVNVTVDASINAAGQSLIQGTPFSQAFSENLFMSLASTALFGTFSRAAAETAQLEGRQARTWATAEGVLGTSLVVGREVGAIAVHTIWGAAIGELSRTLHGHAAPTPMQAREWAMQSVAAAVGRAVHRSIGARLPGLERLQQRRHSAALTRVLDEAHRLQRLADGLHKAPDPDVAAELLTQRTQFLQQEIEAIEQLILAKGDASGDLATLRTELQGQVHESRSQAMVESKLHLLGMQELVPGALWKGTHEQIHAAIEQAQRSGSQIDPHHDEATGRWKLTLDGRVFEIEQVASVGGVRGTAVYPPKTFVKDGVDRKSKLNEASVGKAIKKVTAREHVHGAKLEAQIGKVTAEGANGTLRLPGPHGAHGAVEVQLEIHFKGELTPSTAHGPEAGPARYTLDKSAEGHWVARVEIDQHLDPRDVEFVISHELDEISEIVRRHPTGKPAAGFNAEMTAGVMRSGATTGEATAHDIANAREIVALQKDYDKLLAAKSPHATDRKHMLDRAMEAAGLHEPSQIDAKVRLLREADAPPELLHQVQGVESKRMSAEHVGAMGAKGSNLDVKLIDHVLWPQERSTSEFVEKGMNGGHHTARLLAMGWPNGKYVFVEVATKPAAGSMARLFDQYKWKGAGEMPKPGSGRFPKDNRFDPTGWAKSEVPKTTFDDAEALLREGEDAWQKWLDAGAKPTGNQRTGFAATTTSGIPVAGFFKESDQGITPKSVFVEESWF
jgi:hypothetical protein